MKRFINKVWLGLGLAVISHSIAMGEITLIDKIEIPGTSTDKSGLKEKLEDGSPLSQLGGFSAIASAGDGTYWILPDRGPKDGAVSFPCRVHRMRIELADNGKVKNFELLETKLLKKEGKSLIGLAAAIQGPKPASNLRFDPEGVRALPDGRLAISDEYGPSVVLFNSSSGEAVKWFDTPSRFAVQNPSADPIEEGAANQTGRQPNGGFEGLAYQGDHKTLWAFAQKPLIQDSEALSGGKRKGEFCRIVEFSEAGEVKGEFLYPVENKSSGISEILALGNGQALVLERDGDAGLEAKQKQVYWIDVTEATDSRSVETASRKSLGDQVKPVVKKLWIDFLDPKYGLAGEKFPEKPEGLVFGPTLPDGSRTLLVAIDNDFESNFSSQIWVFRFQATDLPIK